MLPQSLARQRIVDGATMGVQLRRAPLARPSGGDEKLSTARSNTGLTLAIVLAGLLAALVVGCDEPRRPTPIPEPTPQQQLSVTDKFSVVSLTDNYLMMHPGKRKPHRILSECTDIEIVEKPLPSADMLKAQRMAWAGKGKPPTTIDRDYFLEPPDADNGDWEESETKDAPCPGPPSAKPLATCDFDLVKSPVGSVHEHEVYYDLRDVDNRDNSAFLEQECHSNSGIWEKMSVKRKGAAHP